MHTFRCHEQNYRILADVYTLIYTYTEHMQTQSFTINTVEICRRAAKYQSPQFDPFHLRRTRETHNHNIKQNKFSAADTVDLHCSSVS